MAEQYLHRAQVAGFLLNERHLNPAAHRVGAIEGGVQINFHHLFIDQPCILAGADVGGGIGTAWKHIVLQIATAYFKPAQ
jgi:hypothetical protein